MEGEIMVNKKQYIHYIKIQALEKLKDNMSRLAA